MAGKKGVYNNHARKFFLNETYFEKIDENEKAYWLGFIQADGCIYEQKTSLRFQINLAGKDREHLEKLNKALDSTYKVYDKIVKLNGKEYKSSTLQITSKPFAEALMSQGIEVRKSLNENFPSLEKELMSHYIRGFMDGDGSIKVSKRKKEKSYVQVSVRFAGGKGFLEKLRDFLKEELEINFAEKSIRPISGGPTHEFAFSKKENVIKFYEYVYSKNTVCLERKYEKYTNGLSNLYVPYVSNYIQEPGEFMETPNV